MQEVGSRKKLEDSTRQRRQTVEPKGQGVTVLSRDLNFHTLFGAIDRSKWKTAVRLWGWNSKKQWLEYRGWMTIGRLVFGLIFVFFIALFFFILSSSEKSFRWVALPIDLTLRIIITTMKRFFFVLNGVWKKWVKMRKVKEDEINLLILFVHNRSCFQIFLLNKAMINLRMSHFTNQMSKILRKKKFNFNSTIICILYF